MAGIVETPQWEPEVYQFETSDPVEGGPDGIDNVQARQLGNRTQYLKGKVEAAQGGLDAHVAAADPHTQYATRVSMASSISAAIAALVNSSPSTLDTLKEIADALGDDPNFATTITNSLALKAPLAGPTFTGPVKVPTQAIADNSTLAANTAFVQALIASIMPTLVKVSQFSQLVAGNGYVQFPNGIIIQWGSALTNNAGVRAVLATTFPNNGLIAIGCVSATQSSPFIAVAANPARNTCDFFTSNGAGNGINVSVSYIIIGY